jgi:hypothetical protein
MEFQIRNQAHYQLNMPPPSGKKVIIAKIVNIENVIEYIFVSLDESGKSLHRGDQSSRQSTTTLVVSSENNVLFCF